MKSYRHYNVLRLAARFSQEHKIAEDSLLGYSNSIFRAYLCVMPCNHWNPALNLLPLKPAMTLPQRGPKRDFSDIADQRAREIINMAAQSGRQCLVFWSGGIDSTCTLAALLRNGCRPTVALNAQSVFEHPRFYEEQIRDKLDIVFVHDVDYSEDAGYLFVRSSGGSSIMGGDNNSIYLYENYAEARKRVSPEMVRSMGRDVSEHHARLFYDDVMSSAAEMEVEIESLWDFVCFYDLIYKASYEFWLQDHHLFFRDAADSKTIANHWSWVQKFFVTEDFYRWALYDADMTDRLGHKLSDHKWAFKQYIHSVDKNDDYLYKLKTGSSGNWIPVADHIDYLAMDENYLFPSWEGIKDQIYQANSKIL